MSWAEITRLLGDWEGCRVGTVLRFERGVREPLAEVWIELLQLKRRQMRCWGRRTCGQGPRNRGAVDSRSTTSRRGNGTSGNPLTKGCSEKYNFLSSLGEKFYMKTSGYSDSQIMSALNQAESGIAVPELCREHGMSSATFTGRGQNTVTWMLPSWLG